VRNSPEDTKIGEEGGGKGAPDAGAEVPLQSMVQPMVMQAVLCSLWKTMVEQISTCSPGRTPCCSRRTRQEGSCNLWRSCA